MKEHLRLQELIFPQDEKFAQQWELFYHGNRTVYDREKGILYMPAYHVIEFASYLNAFSLHKWKEYTNLQSVKLCLSVQGSFRIHLIGYRLEFYSPVKTVLGTYEYQLENQTELEFVYPESDHALLAFEIETDTPSRIYGGYYEGTFDEGDSRTVDLAIATTTFQKEEFIQVNLESLKKELLETEDEMKNHVWIHVVDNGRTLDPQIWNDENITVYPNKNVGGAGGFARGMLEALGREPKATHVLLMDDDVLILPESIRRMYRLLTVLKPEYHRHFISGAMLCYEEMNIQHEDVGFVHSDGSYGPQKRAYNHAKIEENLQCDKDQLKRQHMYAGWWFCCIPADRIEADGLPLPLFIRGDDVEFSLRSQAEFITMNSICVWHMGFTYKFNAAMELYQVHRNSLIFQAISQVCLNVDFAARMEKLFRARVLSLDYDGAELILDALEDFLKGPEFIAQDIGEQIMREKGKKNAPLVDLKEFVNLDIDLGSIYQELPRRFISKWLYRITYNGHRFCPERVLKEETGIVAYDWFYSPERNFWRRNLLAVNPHVQAGSIRTFSKNKYQKLMRRKKELFKRYKSERAMVEKQYQDQKEYLTSAEFWRQYLEI